jgi:predicted permease
MVAGAGLLLRTLEQMHRIDPGFQPAGVLFVDLADSRKYDSAVGPKRDEVDRIITRLEAVPGVASASAGLSPPFVGHAGFYVKYVADDMSKEDAARMPYANTEVVHPALATTVGLRLLQGRFIEPSDRENAPLVLVINEALAHTLWPGKDPIGRTLWTPAADTTHHGTVVGVVANTRYNELLRAAPMAYLSYRQFQWIPGNYLVRTANDAAARALVPQLRQAIREAVPAVAIRTARPLSEMMAQPLARPRLAAVLVSGFALIVLVLAAIGIYSVMASFVVQRTREIGVRMALGATGPMVHRLVFGQGMLLALIGVGIGLALAAASSRVLKGMLYEVTPADPVTFGVVSVTLIAVAALAVLVPSIRAARLEPVEALRAD